MPNWFSGTTSFSENRWRFAGLIYRIESRVATINLLMLGEVSKILKPSSASFYMLVTISFYR